MRRRCHALAAVLLLAGCMGGPGGRGAGDPPGAGTVAAARAGHLSAAAARDYLAAHPEALVLDVREPAEWTGELPPIPGAKLIPLGDLGGRLGELEAWRERPVIAVCHSGGRSRRAAEMLAAAGFRAAMNLEGGMVGWAQGADPDGP